MFYKSTDCEPNTKRYKDDKKVMCDNLTNKTSNSLAVSNNSMPAPL